MAGMKWQYGTNEGYLANPELSKKIRTVAQPKCVFRQFVRPEPGYGKNKSDRIFFDRVSNVADNASITGISQLSVMPETSITITQGSLSVTEYGQSIPYTGKLEALAEFDPNNLIQKALTNDEIKTLDKVCGVQFRATPVYWTPTGSESDPTGTMDTDGTISTAATRNCLVWDIGQIVDWLKATVLCPPYDGKDYRGISSVKFARAIKEDPKYEDWMKYARPEEKATGEFGKIEGVRFLEETNYLSATLGTTAYNGEAIIFGEDPVVEGIAIPEEIRAKVPTDFGRSKGVAWYFLGGFKIVWPTYGVGKSKIVRIHST